MLINIKSKSKRTTLVIILMTLICNACSTPPLANHVSSTETPEMNTIQSMIKQAQSLPSPQAESALIEAANLLLAQSNSKDASRLLDSISLSVLDPETLAKLVLAKTRLAIQEGKSFEAEELITTDRMGLLSASNALNADLLNEISLLRAETWENNQSFLAAARERIFVAPVLNGIDIITINHDQIWQDLLNIPTETLKDLSVTVGIDDMKGWLELAWIYKGLQDNLDKQLSTLAAWNRRFSTHPAARTNPEAIRLLTELSNSRPQKIALLLPMQGKYAQAAEAILNGFMSAYHQSQTTTHPLTINIYDSSNFETFTATYQTAVDEGAEIIIGPLQKENLRTLLLDTSLPVPTIALNKDSIGLEAPKNLYQFSLSPEDDAQQVADHAKNYGYQRAAVLYQHNPWWERAYGAFAGHWTQEERTINSATSFENQSDIAEAVKSMLLVQQSEQRANQLKRIIGKPFEFQPRRRQDVDFIFLMTTPEQARQIRPLLDFYYAEALPVIAGSQVYSGKPSPKKDRDLNGVEFCDIPWLLEKPDTLKEAMQTAWPKANPRYFRLNAMGVDAFRLQSRIQLLTQLPEAGLFGATGTIKVAEDRTIKRELSWAIMKNGRPELIPKKIDKELLETNDTLENGSHGAIIPPLSQKAN